VKSREREDKDSVKIEKKMTFARAIELARARGIGLHFIHDLSR
jgi:hypothetical protein